MSIQQNFKRYEKKYLIDETKYQALRDCLESYMKVDLINGDEGNFLLPEGRYVMEIKIPGAMPVWMADILDTLQIYPGSFSKYGNVYQTFMYSFFKQKEKQSIESLSSKRML